MTEEEEEKQKDKPIRRTVTGGILGATVGYLSTPKNRKKLAANFSKDAIKETGSNLGIFAKDKLKNMKSSTSDLSESDDEDTKETEDEDTKGTESNQEEAESSSIEEDPKEEKKNNEKNVSKSKKNSVKKPKEKKETPKEETWLEINDDTAS